MWQKKQNSLVDILQVVLTTLDDKMCREVKISPQPRQKLPQTLWKYARTIGNQEKTDRNIDIIDIIEKVLILAQLFKISKSCQICVCSGP